ncbi:cleavage and polyadenylation specificity factor [Schizosaccharomyces japonicus yFS275]|uniref:Cleavage and polyadenylation specificity factor n=1 Tax=Schizosaccharomyces japonicus (strain yFS275 / FY16936) TaxID=402676 RepID=B6JZJ7_SCHJY|nr:cleavage and polyadenylation specificity factor [Schizosaccharomyces japonicus yFS275]EEB06965.1 cleavage and polyadenylation specificity factor [Schizosaccharomyces japonicus yFS275]
MDLVELDYFNALNDLTFNSKPIIHTLTAIAQENRPYAVSVVNALQHHLQKCPPAQKLPALYLLDSISKNLAEPYTSIVAPRLYTMFMDAYTVVDSALRPKFDQLFETWKRQSPNASIQGPVYPESVTKRIELALTKYKETVYKLEANRLSSPFTSNARLYNKYGSVPLPVASTSRISPPPSSVSVESLLEEIKNLSLIEQSRCVSNPMDGNARTRLVVLNKLHEVLSVSRLTESQLAAIKSQLVQLRTPNHHPSAPAPMAQQAAYAGHPAGVYNPPKAPKAMTSLKGSSPSPYAMGPAALMNQQPGYPMHNAYRQPAAPAANNIPTENVNAFFASLQAAGIVPNSASGSPALYGTSVPFTVELTKESLSKPRPELVTQLYDLYPNHCANCGRRYADDAKGRELRDAHYDWHFRINKRIRESNVHSISRCWFLKEENWVSINDNEDAIPETEEDRQEKEKKAHESVVSQYVLTPSDPTQASQPCSICQEKFQSIWHEDAEVWVFMNAVERDGRIYHATCLHEYEKTASKDSAKTSAAAGSTANAPVVKSTTDEEAVSKQESNENKPSDANVSNLLQGIDVAGILSAIGKRKERESDVDMVPNKFVKQEND